MVNWNITLICFNWLRIWIACLVFKPLWKTTASALSMNLVALILTFVELILPKNQSTACKMEWELHSNNNSNNEMIKTESPSAFDKLWIKLGVENLV